ncbi:MAG: class I SAM-dependent methyltransferase [Verrucomicrobia bacterium]|nr:class I SAM-dependent methyltransferase [Verrucomicrobiota bacterium]
MNDSLKAETEKLSRSWSQYEAPFLQNYLVADVEDPRINVQSILSRHFLLGTLLGEKIQAVLAEELRFAAAMNWLLKLRRRAGDSDELRAVLYALKRGADNAEGTDIPHLVVQTFGSLPASTCGGQIPNYIEDFLSNARAPERESLRNDTSLDAFLRIWNEVLSHKTPQRISVLEPACGSANDYRFLVACGIARCIDYTGIDLCEKNVQNAQAMFPGVRFEVGNIFEINSADQSFDFCFVHDLFEHLSLSGLESAVKEICRVVRRGICVGFFQMDEIPEHVVRPVDDYHWNMLSMEKTKGLFTQEGFTVQVFHIGSYLRSRIGCNETHNLNAYTFVAVQEG